jgi:hypothetical protein
MPQLRQLRCSLTALEPPSHPLRPLQKQFNEEREREFLAPLKQIDKPDKFEVVLKWEELPDSVTKTENFPFTILWREEAVVV